MQNEKKSVFARDAIKKGEEILEFEKNFLNHPTKTSLQVDEGVHQESTNPKSAENFINHSCDPNAYLFFADLTLHALRDIKKGEEITFNYLTTAWDLSNKFECKYGSGSCFLTIRGFRYLSMKDKIRLEPFLSPFLKKKFRSGVFSYNP